MSVTVTEGPPPVASAAAVAPATGVPASKWPPVPPPTCDFESDFEHPEAAVKTATTSDASEIRMRERYAARPEPSTQLPAYPPVTWFDGGQNPCCGGR